MKKPSQHRVWIDVDVCDIAALKAYAEKRAIDGGMSVEEFTTGEHEGEDLGLNISYWLMWAFDAGTPLDAGFEIIDSGVEDQN